MQPSPSPDTYRLDLIKNTPYPNRLLELSITLPETQARIVNLVVRSSLGWYGGAPGTRKASAFFSPAILRQQVGRTTSIAVIDALDALVAQGVLEVLTPNGKSLPEGSYYGQALRLRISRNYVEG